MADKEASFLHCDKLELIGGGCQAYTGPLVYRNAPIFAEPNLAHLPTKSDLIFNESCFLSNHRISGRYRVR
jgi:hypothetical protein